MKPGTKLQENQSISSFKGQIEEIHNQEPFWKKGTKLQGLNLIENMGEIKEIKILKVL